MSAIDDLFEEIERHKVMMAHASLLLAAKQDVAALRAEHERLKQQYAEAYTANCGLLDAAKQLRAKLDEALETIRSLKDGDEIREP